MELKTMLAHMLLNYDLSLPDGVKTVPKPMALNGSVLPNPNACVVVRPRVGQVGQDL
jgi:hypothetical protein